jgi:hypothetical protein
MSVHGLPLMVTEAIFLLAGTRIESHAFGKGLRVWHFPFLLAGASVEDNTLSLQPSSTDARGRSPDSWPEIEACTAFATMREYG